MPDNSIMINTAHPLVQTLHRAICMVYNCGHNAITGISDTKEKQCAIFMLKHFYGFLPNDIALPYSVGVPRVKNICHKMPVLYGMSVNFQNKVKAILDYVETNCET